MKRASRSELSATVSKLQKDGYTVVSKEYVGKTLKFTLTKKEKTVAVRFTANGWMELSNIN